MFLIAGYCLLICLEMVTANAGRKKSVYQKDLSDICKKRIVSSVFLGSGVLETDSETLDLSRLELPYDCFVKVKAEPGSNIILVAQIESTDDLTATCDRKPNQFLVLDMAMTYGGYWEMQATDFSTPEYHIPRPKRTWDLLNYNTPEVEKIETDDLNTDLPMPTTMFQKNILKSSSPRPTVTDNIPTRTVHTKTQAFDTIEITDTYSNEENNFGNKKPFKDQDIITVDDKKSFDEVNLEFENKTLDEQDDFLENDSEENDSKPDGVDTEEEETIEMVKVPVLEPDSKEITPTPHHYEKPKPHIHFAPRYKNIISPKRSKNRGKDSDFVDNGSLDYIWGYKKPTQPSTKHSWRTYPTVIGYNAWQRLYGDNRPYKYVDYDDGEEKRKPIRRKPNSSKRLFFNADKGPVRITSHFKMLTLRTRLRYFQDSITKTMKSTTQSKQRLVTHKAPHFKLKSTTKSATTFLKNKTFNFTNDDLSNSTEAWWYDDKYELSYLTNRISKTKSKADHKLKVTSNKTNISRETTVLNKNADKKARKNTTNADNVASITTVSMKTLRSHQTQKVAKTKMQAKSSMSTTMTRTKDIKPHITVSSQKAPTPTKIMKHNIEDNSKITKATTNEHDFLKYLLSNFRRKAKADVVPLTRKSTANTGKTILPTARNKTIEPLSKHTVTLSSIKRTRTTLKLTSPTQNIFNQTAAAAVPTASTVIFNMSTSKALETTKQDNFKLTKTTPMPSFQHKFETTLTRTSLLKTTSSMSNTTEILNITTKDTTPVSFGKTDEIYASTIPKRTSLNITEKTNATLPLNTTATTQSDLIKFTTKSHLSSQHNVSDKAIFNVTIIKEGISIVTVLTKNISAHTQATSQTYQPETKTMQDNNKSSTIVTTIQSSQKIKEDSKPPSKPPNVVVELDILKTTTKATQEEKENDVQNVIPLAVTSLTILTSSEKTIAFDKVTNITQGTPKNKTSIFKISSSVTKETETIKNVSLTTVPTILMEIKTTLEVKDRDTKSSQAKMFVAAPSTTRKSASVEFSGGSNVTRNKPQHVNLFSAETWNKSTLAYKSWENLIQAAPDMMSSLNRTRHLWKPKSKKAKTPKPRKRVKRRLEYIPIEDSKPHTREVMPTTSKKTLRHAADDMDIMLADDQKEENFGRAHFGRLENYLGNVLFNICTSETKKTRIVTLFNTSNIILIMNDFNLERLNLIVTSATTIAQTRTQCPLNELECQVSGVRVCIDMSSACDDIPNCGAYDIYDEDRILCGFNIIFRHSLVLTAVTFIVIITIGIYSVHYWLERCIPHVSEAFFVYTDAAENVLYLDTIMRSPNATDDFPPPKYHVPGFEEELRLRKRMVKRGLCSLLFRRLCPCFKMFKHTEEAPISLEEFDRGHSDTGSPFDKMFQYSDGVMDRFETHRDDKATQTSFTLERATSFHNKSLDSLMNKLGDLRNSHSYNNEIELIKKMRDNSEIKKKAPTLPQEESTSSPSNYTQRATVEEEELRNTVYDMGMTLSPVVLYEQEFIEQLEDDIEALAEPTKRLRFNEEEAGPSDLQQENKAKKAAIDSRRRTSVDLNKKKNSMFSKF